MPDYQLTSVVTLSELKPFLQPLEKKVGDHSGQNELEIQFGRDSGGYFGEIGQGMFQKILESLKASSLVKNRSHSETLDVSFRTKTGRQLRATISGRQKIMAFCREDYTALYNSIVIEKKPSQVDKTYQEALRSQFGMKINLKQEIPAVPQGQDQYFHLASNGGHGPSREVSNRLDECKDSLKTFRYKHRFSFEFGDGFRFDLTTVKSSQSGYTIYQGNKINTTLRKKKTFLEARVLSQPEKFEVELEFPQHVPKDQESLDRCHQKCLSYANLILTIQQDTLLPTSQLASSKYDGGVIQEYNTVTSQHFSIKQKFLGPKPFSFELRNLHGSNSIENGYTVTDKADGEGNLLFFDGNGIGYLIDSNLRVRSTGIHIPKLKHTILNGEYLNYRLLDGERLKAFDFYVYDIYLYKGKDVASLPLGSKDKGESRIQSIRKAVESIQSKTKTETDVLEVYAKTFYFVGDVGETATNIFELSRKCWKKFEDGLAPYIYDGLIYTPLSEGLTADTLGKTWRSNLKWKPPHENTVDFLTQIRKDEKRRPIIDSKMEVDSDGVLKEIQYKTVDLFVGGTKRFQENACQPVRYQSYGKMKFIPESPPDEKAHEAKIPIKNGKIIAYDDKSVVEDYTIVEFSYNIDLSTWEPKRTRFDKTYGYHRDIEIQKKLYYLLTQWARNQRDGAPEVASLTHFKEWHSLDGHLTMWMRSKWKKEKAVPFDFRPNTRKLVGLHSNRYDLSIHVFLWLCYFLEGSQHSKNEEIQKYCEERTHLRHNPILKKYLMDNVNTLFRNFSVFPVGLKPGNDISVANSVWKTIHMPITLDVITTGENIPPLDAEEDVYYEISLQERNTMQKFHNWIKKYYTLLNTRKLQFESKNPSHYNLIDLACGKGGDLLKWRDLATKYPSQHKTKVLGLDIITDNLENPYNGACKRWNDMQQDEPIIKQRLEVEFRQHDSSSPIRQVEAFHSGSYDMVSVQFALHYFFQTNKTLETFVHNVSQSLVQDGYFVGTCFNGEVVFRELAGKPFLEGKTPQGKLLWSIEKKYNKEEEGQYSQGGPESCGKAIEVFVSSINRRHQEYLVNWNYLVEMLGKKGIKPLTEDEARQLGMVDSDGNSFYDTERGIASFSDIIRISHTSGEKPTTNSAIESKDATYGKYLVQNLTDVEKQFSDKNVVFIYRADKTSVK